MEKNGGGGGGKQQGEECCGGGRNPGGRCTRGSGGRCGMGGSEWNRKKECEESFQGAGVGGLIKGGGKSQGGKKGMSAVRGQAVARGGREDTREKCEGKSTGGRGRTRVGGMEGGMDLEDIVRTVQGTGRGWGDVR